MPPGPIPPDIIERHDLLSRLWIDPYNGLNAPHGRAPLTEVEWRALVPLPEEAAGGRAAWKALPLKSVIV
ncbi:MAG: hypothetical protein ACOYO0_09695 [Sandarakinorhabdus sp.]